MMMHPSVPHPQRQQHRGQDAAQAAKWLPLVLPSCAQYQSKKAVGQFFPFNKSISLKRKKNKKKRKKQQQSYFNATFTKYIFYFIFKFY